MGFNKCILYGLQNVYSDQTAVSDGTSLSAKATSHRTYSHFADASTRRVIDVSENNIKYGREQSLADVGWTDPFDTDMTLA